MERMIKIKYQVDNSTTVMFIGFFALNKDSSLGLEIKTNSKLKKL